MGKQEIALNGEVPKYELHPYEHHTRYYETDQMGVIHQTNYIKWLEDARMDIMKQMGLGYKQMEQMQIICPLLSESVNYISMVRFDETVVIDTKVVKYDGRQMNLEYTIYDKETQEVRATASSSHCFMNRSGRAISLKKIYPELDTTFFEI